MMRILLLLPLTLLAAACSSFPPGGRQEFPDACWAMSDTLTWMHDNSVPDSLTPRIRMTFEPGYRYRNVHLRLRWTAPSGAIGLLTLQDTLLDAEGNWLAGNDARAVQAEIGPAAGIRLAETGAYRFQLYHYMRDSALCQVRSVEAGLE